MFYPVPVVVAQKIKAEAVGSRIVNVKQEILEHRPLGLVNVALKHGILHAYPKVQTSFGNMAQPAFSRQINRAHIVTDKNKHKIN